jgi:transposase
MASLAKQFEQLKRQVQLLTARIEVLEEQVAERDKKIRSLELEKQTLLKRLYGPKSDRPSDEAQLMMEEIMLAQDQDGVAAPDEKDGEEPEEEPEPGRAPRRQGPTGRQILPDHLEERVEVIDLSPEKKFDPHSGLPLVFIGYDETRRLAEQPAQLYVRVIRRAKYARPGGGGDGGLPGVLMPPLPDDNPIERCKADTSVLANIITEKYLDHGTLYRIQERYWRTGRVWLPRSTLCGWVGGCAEALEPIYREMIRRIMESGLTGLDDTSIKMLEPGLGKTWTARLWAYVGLLPQAAFIVYDFRPTREKEGPLEFYPQTYRGYVQGDAYSGHDQLMKRPGIIEAGCWDHARRYFVEASATEPAQAAQVLACIRLLYRVERELAEASPEQKLVMRQEKSRPVLAELKGWLEEHRGAFLPKSPMTAAIGYTLNQWTALNVYTEDGRLPISNIAAEQAMRGVAIGRKNWLFAGSPEGGRWAAILYSLTMTCRKLGINARLYLEDVLRRINTHPQRDIGQLLPDGWKAEQEADGVVVTHRLPEPRRLAA